MKRCFTLLCCNVEYPRRLHLTCVTVLEKSMTVAPSDNEKIPMENCCVGWNRKRTRAFWKIIEIILVLHLYVFNYSFSFQLRTDLNELCWRYFTKLVSGWRLEATNDRLHECNTLNVQLKRRQRTEQRLFVISHKSAKVKTEVEDQQDTHRRCVIINDCVHSVSKTVEKYWSSNGHCDVTAHSIHIDAGHG